MIQRICGQCGDEFETEPARVRQGGGKFCSRTCTATSKRGKPTGRARSPRERFYGLVDKDGPIPAHAPNLGPCWVWQGSLKADGYGGTFDHNGHAHQWAWVDENGPVPLGLELDHLCRTRACVRPSHLEAVTHAENVRRGGNTQKTHCPKGHPYDEINTYYEASYGGRRCRACRRALDARRAGA